MKTSLEADACSGQSTRGRGKVTAFIIVSEYDMTNELHLGRPSSEEDGLGLLSRLFRARLSK